jgi:glycosyltransferase involved in cell wall biosynthesis
VCGYHVPFGDTEAFAEKVNLLFSDRHLAAKMGWNGLLRVKSKFHIKENSRMLLELYGSLVRR